MYNILFVEGKSSLGLELTSALTEDNFNVTGVSDYFEALGRLNEFKPDMVIMNIELPWLDGWEACSWLHETFGIPIILLGRDTSAETWVRAVRAGADFYLRVPFSWRELTARVKAILRRYQKG
jgi:DNA-binding response OmpR family regulator